MPHTAPHLSLTGQNVVVGAIDDNMVYPVLVWAHSLHATAKSPPHFVIGFLSGLLSAHNQSSVDKVLTYLGISHEFMELAPDSRFITQGHISPTTFAKFLLADKIQGLNVWIDIDTVATNGWDAIFSLIADSPQKTKLVVASRGKDSATKPIEARKPSDLLFNAGVLGWPARPRIPWSKQLDRVEETVTQEQYVFNSLYASQLTHIPEAYNTLTYRLDQVNNSALPFIIHFAGAHKPWHMPRRFTRVCCSYRCPWSVWFDAERAMLAAIEGSPLAKQAYEMRTYSLTSGALATSRDNSGRALLVILRQLGVLGWLLVVIAKPFSRWIPRGTHPLH